MHHKIGNITLDRQSVSGVAVGDPARFKVYLANDSGSTSTTCAWQEPVGSRYENFSVLLVKIEPALRPYASDQDLMALFVGNM